MPTSAIHSIYQNMFRFLITHCDRIMNKTHMYDATEIFRTLSGHKKESFIKLGFYLLSFFYYLYRFALPFVKWFIKMVMTNRQLICLSGWSLPWFQRANKVAKGVVVALGYATIAMSYIVKVCKTHGLGYSANLRDKCLLRTNTWIRLFTHIRQHRKWW